MESYVEQSKFLSYVLRHGAHKLGMYITKDGYMYYEDLIAQSIIKGHPLTYSMIDEIVSTDNKGRYSTKRSVEGQASRGPLITLPMIRANQGHSFPVELGMKAQVPPIPLWHGTPVRNREAILKQGICKLKREYVHLSADKETAWNVADRRRSDSMLFVIDTRQMYADGIKFYMSDNGVWLTDHVSPKYLIGEIYE